MNPMWLQPGAWRRPARGVVRTTHQRTSRAARRPIDQATARACAHAGAAVTTTQVDGAAGTDVRDGRCPRARGAGV